MGMQIKNPPLFCKLTAIQFNPVEKMGEYIGQIQDEFRKADYSDYSKSTAHGFKPNPVPEDPFNLEQVTSTRWLFANQSLSEVYIVDQTRLVFMTTDYKNSDDFLEKTLMGLSLLHEILHLDFIERVGVRTVDVICPSGDSAPNDYFNGLLDGFSPPDAADPLHKLSESAFLVGGGQLTCRAFQVKSGIAMPDDLTIEPLKADDKFVGYKGITATLDIDHFVKQRSSFELEILRERIMHSHRIVADMFYRSISTHAKQDWGVKK